LLASRFGELLSKRFGLAQSSASDKGRTARSATRVAADDGARRAAYAPKTPVQYC
jgi:hypothetical protein